MKAPRRKSQREKTRLNELLDLRFCADQSLVIVLIISMAMFAPVNVFAKESPVLGQNGTSEATENGATAGTQGAATSDYRLAPGDVLTVVVLDQAQLSGKFVIDGGGAILLPLAGTVSVVGLTLAEAQQTIQQSFADGVLVQPGVSVRLTEFRPIFVTGNVRKPGSYRFTLGESVKAAIATAGGEGPAIDQPLSVATSDYITAAQRLQQLETDQATLLVRKARLEAQRDGRQDFVMPLAVGFNYRNVDLDRAYSGENETFLRLADTYRRQLQTLEEQRPRIQAELDAITAQIGKQKEHLDIVNGHLADLETLFAKGLLRKDVLLNQQIEKTLVEAQLSNLGAQVAHLRQAMGDLDIKAEDLKANFEKQTLTELQETAQRLREVENSIGPARKILQVKAEAASGDSEDGDYTMLVSRPRDGRIVTFEVSSDDMLSPGDVVEVKMKRRASTDEPSASTQAMQSLDPISSLGDDRQALSR